MSKLGLLLNARDCAGESLEDFADIGAGLHGDNSKLIFLIDPHKEGLCLVVEDSTSLRPFSLKESRLEVLVVTLEKEVVFSELFLLISSHCGE